MHADRMKIELSFYTIFAPVQGGIITTVPNISIMRISSTLDKKYRHKIDLKDLNPNLNKNESENVFLTRSLAAFSLAQIAEIDDCIAAAHVIDGFDDNGIDAIYFDNNSKVVYIVQSKWIQSGKKAPDRADIQKFLKGFKDLLNADFKQFNDKLNNIRDEIEEALYDAQVKFILIIAYTGSQPLSPNHAQHDIESLLKELNDPIELVTYQVLSQKELYNAAAGLVEGAPINLDILVRNWGQIDEPYLAYYGQVDAVDIASWWQSHSDRLFVPNLRKFLGSTEVNDSIINTITKNPEKFWYFNNGITILCNMIKQQPIGKGSKKSGVFECEGMSIVNGAQTVGSIAKAYASTPEKVSIAHVPVRLISLENCPEGFATEVTRATNTQNKIERRDFISLDNEQKRLQTDLSILCDKEYIYKSGDKKPTPENGCDIEEATIALACADSNVELAVQAKREIGKLWENTEKPPYRLLFNSKLTAMRLWRSVEIFRAVEDRLKILQPLSEGRERLIAIHGNRFILHKVFRTLPIERLDDPSIDLNNIKKHAYECTDKVLLKLIESVNSDFPNSYPANLFKNKSKCLKLSQVMDK